MFRSRVGKNVDLDLDSKIFSSRLILHLDFSEFSDIPSILTSPGFNLTSSTCHFA